MSQNGAKGCLANVRWLDEAHMNFKDALKEAIGMLASMFSRGFLIFIFGILLPLMIGLVAFAIIILWSAYSGYYVITAFSLLAGVGWIFFWLNFTDGWIT